MALSPVGQHVLSVLAIVLLGADLLVSAFLSRRRRKSRRLLPHQDSIHRLVLRHR